MNVYVKLAIAAAAVVVVAIVGINLLPRNGGVAGPGSTPTPSPTPTVSPTPAASPMALREGALPAGTYVSTPFSQSGSDACFAPPQAGCIDPITDDAIRVTFTLPDGWDGSTDGASPTSTGNDAPDGAGVLFVRGAWLLTDPCQNGANPDIPVGPTVDEFANALANHPILTTTTPADVTLGGYSGKYMDLQVPTDISRCDVYRPWEPGVYAQGPGHRWHLWILDVDGVRVVVQSMDYAGTSAQHEAELKAIVDSIRIER